MDLHEAVSFGDVGRVRLLLDVADADFDINKPDPRSMLAGYPALGMASRFNYLAVAELLVSRGADVNGPSRAGYTPLMEAAENGFLEIAQLLVRNGARLEDVDYNGHTALMWGATKDRVELEQFLVESGCQINARDNTGATALDKAVSRRSRKTFHYLVVQGADDGTDGTRAMDWAVRNDMVSTGRFLVVDRGYQVGRQDSVGRTALHQASAAGSIVVAKFLTTECNGGADIVNVLDRSRSSPLMLAAAGGHLEVVKHLLSLGADVHATNVAGVTALLLAAELTDDAELVKALLMAGSDVYQGRPHLDLRPDGEGLTAIDLALRRRHPGVVVEVLQVGWVCFHVLAMRCRRMNETTRADAMMDQLGDLAVFPEEILRLIGEKSCPTPNAESLQIYRKRKRTAPFRLLDGENSGEDSGSSNSSD